MKHIRLIFSFLQHTFFLPSNGQIDNKEDKEKEKLIMDLENSNSFKQTHSIISELKKIKNWTLEEKKRT